MLGEGFLRVLRYREERKFAEGQTKVKDSIKDGGHNSCSGLGSAGQGELTGKGHLHHEAPAPHRHPPGLLIPGRPPALSADPLLVECSLNCSLLEHYPDLQVADSGPLLTPRPASSAPPQPLVSPPIDMPPPPPPPDQGYLVMGNSGVNISVDVPELRTNSVLNGMLEKKLEEVYLQHLTDNLARCNLNSGHSLLHGLVPPPQPNTSQAPESLVVSVGEAETSSEKTIGYFNTNSNFSSAVVLRISEN